VCTFWHVSARGKRVPTLLNEEERKRLYEAVYESDHWKNYIAPQVPDMLFREQSKVTRIEATPKSVIQ